MKKGVSGLMANWLFRGLVGLPFTGSSLAISPETPQWAIKTIVSETGTGSWFIRACMVLDSNNKPHIIFQDLDEFWNYARIQVDMLGGTD